MKIYILWNRCCQTCRNLFNSIISSYRAWHTCNHRLIRQFFTYTIFSSPVFPMVHIQLNFFQASFELFSQLPGRQYSNISHFRFFATLPSSLQSASLPTGRENIYRFVQQLFEWQFWQSLLIEHFLRICHK